MGLEDLMVGDYVTHQYYYDRPVKILNPMYGKKRPIEVVNKMSHSMALKYNMPVIQYTKDGKFVKEWICAAVAEKYIGVNQNHIRDCCRGKVKSAGGYIWKFAKD